jgi:hypothetical protein
MATVGTRQRRARSALSCSLLMTHAAWRSAGLSIHVHQALSPMLQVLQIDAGEEIGVVCIRYGVDLGRCAVGG